MRPPVRSPRLRCVLFPSMCLPHLLVLPATFGLQCLLPPYPYFRALYAVPVRQARDLLTASFRFPLTVDTLAVQLCASSLPTRTRDLHPLENAHAGQTKRPAKSNRLLLVLLQFCMTATTVQISSELSLAAFLFQFIRQSGLINNCTPAERGELALCSRAQREHMLKHASAAY